ncbi:serine/threonine protein kinase [Rhizobium lemnae]|uniref:Serine/threonine protein kinase n=1 Tax=Rhizobium lemnae TaxID=1214924 RepID=A0ABV8EF58_9HYPH
MRNLIRDALDRGSTHNSAQSKTDIIANSFTVEDILAYGRETEILAVRHRDLGSQFALKLLRQNARYDPISRELLIQEASVGLRFAHPCILRTHMLLRLEDGRPAILMERGGPSLYAIATQQALTAQLIFQVAEDVLLALEQLHSAGFAHGDLSPANILRTTDDPASWKLSDFGLCRHVGSGVPHEDTKSAGTPDFQAPEQACSKPLDCRADLYSLGRVLQWMLQRQQGDGYEDKVIRGLASSLTEVDPESRPKDASQCRATLLHLRTRK